MTLMRPRALLYSSTLSTSNAASSPSSRTSTPSFLRAAG